MSQKDKRVLLIGEQPDIEIFAMLGGDGYEIAVFESPHRANIVFSLYKPHVVIVFPRYPKDIAMLEECLAVAGTVPVVAAISLLAKQTLVKAVKEKATDFIVLPAKPQTVRETLRGVALFDDKDRIPAGGKKILGTASPRGNRPHSADSL